MILLQIPDLETIVHDFDIIHVLLVSYIKMFYGSCFPYLVLSYVPRLHHCILRILEGHPWYCSRCAVKSRCHVSIPRGSSQGRDHPDR